MLGPNGSNKKWSGADVKKFLPGAPVRESCGAYCVGIVSGRLNRFATITLSDGQRADFAWSAIARALNGGARLSF